MSGRVCLELLITTYKCLIPSGPIWQRELTLVGVQRATVLYAQTAGVYLLTAHFSDVMLPTSITQLVLVR